MKLICVDLEMNKHSKKIIQIGAVCFEPGKDKLVDIFNMYVDPYEPIDPFIIQLTGITNEKVIGMPSIQEAANNFSNWKNQHQANPIAIVWGSGKSNDVRKIYEESGINSPFNIRIIDVKAIYQMLANISNADMRSKVGLNKALTNLGLEWNYSFGKQHDAFSDAYHTMVLYNYLSKCLKGGHMIKSS